jgi:hypothetical protein
MEILDTFLENLVIVMIIVNTFLFIYSYKKHSKSLPYRLICLYLTCSLIINLSVFILAMQRVNNLYFSHYYFILQFVILSLFYRALLKKNQKKIVSILLILVTSILFIQYIIWPKLYFKFNTTEVFITSFPIVMYSVIHLYNSLSKSLKYMYINAGILIYITTSTLIFILGDYLSVIDSKASSDIWFINEILYIIYLALIFTEWWKNFRTVKNK